MYIIFWDDGETETYYGKYQLIERVDFLVNVLGYYVGRDFVIGGSATYDNENFSSWF